MKKVTSVRTILLFTKVFSPSNTGFGNAATSLAGCLSKMPGTNLVVITAQEKDCDEKAIQNTKIVRINENCCFLTKFMLKEMQNTLVKKLLRAVKLDWLHVWLIENEQYRASLPYVKESGNVAFALFETNNYPFLGSRIVRKLPGKTVMRIHATMDTEQLVYGKRNMHNSWLQRRIADFCKKCPAITSTTSYYLSFFKDTILKNNIYDIWSKMYYGVIPNTVGEVDYPVTSHVVPEQAYCLMLGKLSFQGWTQKGFADLLEAVHFLRENGDIPSSFRLVIVGAGSQERRLKRILRLKGLNDQIVHMASVKREDMLCLMNNARFIVLPSRFEGQSMFLTEALMMAKPIITTCDTGAVEMVEEQKNGILFKAGDVKELGHALTSLWNSPEDDLVSMGDHSRVLYEKYFSEKRVLDRLLELRKRIELGI